LAEVNITDAWDQRPLQPLPEITPLSVPGAVLKQNGVRVKQSVNLVAASKVKQPYTRNSQLL